MYEDKYLQKKEQIVFYIANSGRLASKLDCWQLMHSPESAQNLVLGTGYF